MMNRAVRSIVGLILFVLFFSSAEAGWLATARSGGTAYFLFDSPAEIQRYDLGTGAWLAPIPLAAIPTAFTADDQALYVAFGRRTSRFALDGTGEQHLRNTAGNVFELAVGPTALYLFSGGYTSSNLQAVDKTDGTLISEASYWYSMSGVSIAPTVGRLFGRSQGVIPCDIVQVDLGPNGGTVGQYESPYHGDYPCGTRTFVFPGEARVADNSGIVYSTNDLRYNNSFAGAFDDLAFYGTVPIVLRGNTLSSYTNTFLLAGRAVHSRTASRIYVEGDSIFSFYYAAGKLGVIETAVSALTPPEPGEPVDPRGLVYVPDAVFLGSDGVVYLLSKANLSVFRWSLALAGYLPAIPLAEAPRYMAYSDVSRRIYLAYPSGSLRTIDLDAQLVETPFANLPQQPLGLVAAGEFVFACDPTGAWTSHWTFSPGGSVLSQVEWNYYSREYTWSPANRRMYFFRDDTSPNDLQWESIDTSGKIVSSGDSPYHGDVTTILPIRVAPDGSVVLLGSGEIYDARSIVHVDNLSNNISDAAWLQGVLFTTRPSPPYTEVQRWTGSYANDHSFMVTGSPIRMFAFDDRLLVITSVAGIPRFTLRPPDAGDIDNDGVADHLDNCPEIPNPGQADGDSDGAGDDCDNCVAVYNPGQENGNSDPEGDACELKVTFPLDPDDVSCSGSPPTVTWTRTAYNRFKVYLSVESDFEGEGMVWTSGDTMLRGNSWKVPAKKWKKVCAKAQPNLYLMVLGRIRNKTIKDYSQVVSIEIR